MQAGNCLSSVHSLDSRSSLSSSSRGAITQAGLAGVQASACPQNRASITRRMLRPAVGDAAKCRYAWCVHSTPSCLSGGLGHPGQRARHGRWRHAARRTKLACKGIGRWQHCWHSPLAAHAACDAQCRMDGTQPTWLGKALPLRVKLEVCC